MHGELFGEDVVSGERPPLLSHIDYSADLPEELTKESYIYMYRQVWAIIRHDLYKDIAAA